MADEAKPARDQAEPVEALDPGLRERTFAWLDPRWILYEDDALIAIDKPAGVPTQEARPGAEDDLPTRVARFLAARDGSTEPYLGVHQRLDKETSGVVLYAKARAANAALARQMESRAVEKRYVAGVERWAHGERATFRDQLAPARGGGVEVVRAGGKLAITHARRVAALAADARREAAERGDARREAAERGDDRTLLEITIETGRTHQIRAQLASHGSPIAGDALYGGARAPRLMLHASSLSLAHPITGAPLVIETASKKHPALDTWMMRRPTSLEGALELAVQRRFALGRAALREPDARTTAFRLLNEDGDGASGVSVDVYADWAVLHTYDESVDECAVLDAVERLGLAGIYVKRRPRQANELGDDARAELAPNAPVRGRAAPEALVIREHGMRFVVRLGDGMSTGLFLDQREHRARVRAMASGARVLNLFAYTCGFSVAAVVGGASTTTSVDASGVALDRGRANLELAGAGRDAHRTIRADVFDWLDRAARRGERFDLVCCDPPTYSTTKKARWTSGRQWRALAASCLRVLAPGGVLLATSNDRRMSQGALRAELREGAKQAGVELESLRDLPPPEDFPAAIGAEPHLKAVLARVTSSACA